MIAYIIEIRNQNSLYNSVNLTNLSQVAKLNSMCIFNLQVSENAFVLTTMCLATRDGSGFQNDLKFWVCLP